MDLSDFIKKFRDQFEESESGNIFPETSYKSLDTWDSLTAMSVQVMIEDDYGVKIKPSDFKEAATVTDLFNLVASKK